MTRPLVIRSIVSRALIVLGAQSPLAAQTAPEPVAAETLALGDALRTTVAAKRVPAMRFGDVSDVRSTLRGLYEAAGWQPLWLDSAGMPTDAARALIAHGP
jgi:hypothetical protein